MKKLTSSIIITLLCASLIAQVGGWNPTLEKDAEAALKVMITDNSKLNVFLETAYAYVVFPKITKGAYVLGGAVGKGVAYKNNVVIGYAKLRQANIGFQLGGQQYMEVIFFETASAFKNFANGKLKLDAQASAVVLKEGASIDLSYEDQVAIFTKTKSGLMFEASVGGQKFKYKAVKRR